MGKRIAELLEQCKQAVDNAAKEEGTVNGARVCFGITSVYIEDVINVLEMISPKAAKEPTAYWGAANGGL